MPKVTKEHWLASQKLEHPPNSGFGNPGPSCPSLHCFHFCPEVSRVACLVRLIGFRQRTRRKKDERMGTRELIAPQCFGCPWWPIYSVWTQRNQGGEIDAQVKEHHQGSENPRPSWPSLHCFHYCPEVSHVAWWVPGYKATNNVEDLELSYSLVTKAIRIRWWEYGN